MHLILRRRRNAVLLFLVFFDVFYAFFFFFCVWEGDSVTPGMVRQQPQCKDGFHLINGGASLTELCSCTLTFQKAKRPYSSRVREQSSGRMDLISSWEDHPFYKLEPQSCIPAKLLFSKRNQEVFFVQGWTSFHSWGGGDHPFNKRETKSFLPANTLYGKLKVHTVIELVVLVQGWISFHSWGITPLLNKNTKILCL